MSPTIEKLLLQITYVCLHINAQGKWHAFISISGHVHQIDVWLLPASTIYKEGEPHERAFSESVYFRREPRHGWQTAPEQEARIGAELLAMLANLEPFLAPESSEVAA